MTNLKFHTFTFQFPRLLEGEIFHKEKEAFIIETLQCPLLTYVFSCHTKRWYQHQTTKPQGNQRIYKFQRLEIHEVPKRIRTHALLLGVA